MATSEFSARLHYFHSGGSRHTSRTGWRRRKHLQQQAGVQLDLEEDSGKQRDVNQTKQVVDDLLFAGKPDAQQAKHCAYGFNP